MQTVYRYDAETGEYRGDVSASESPLEPGVPLIPLDCTRLKPPAAPARQTPVFDGKRWRLVPDWRDVPLFNTADGAPAPVTLGVLPAEAGATEQARPGPEYVWRQGAWAYDANLAAALFRQRREEVLADLLVHIAEQRDIAAGSPSAGEMQSRAAKRVVAAALLLGEAAEAQSVNLAMEAELRGMGETVEELAHKILARAQALDAVNAKLDGLKRAAENALLAAATPEELGERAASFRTQVAAVVVAAGASE